MIMVEFLIVWKLREKKGKNSKYLIIVRTKKSGVSPVMELKNMESVHLWNQEIRSPSTFGTKVWWSQSISRTKKSGVYQISYVRMI